MSRTLDAAMIAHLATGRTRLSRCLRLDLRDGTTIGITDHDTDLTVSLGNSPGEIYKADTGVLPSAVSLSLGLEADSMEARGPLTAMVPRAAVIGGRFNSARARLFDVRWDSPTHLIRLLSGKVSNSRVEAGEFVLEVRSASDAFNQTIGRVISPYCSNDFGVDDPPRSRCRAVPAEYQAQVIAVTDDLHFRVAWTSSPAPLSADAVRNGSVTFDTGDLAGTLPVEVFNLSGSPLDSLEVYAPLAELPQVGDTLTVTEGCDQTRPTCKLKGQILQFSGFPDLGGTDKYVKFPDPGAG